MKDNKFNFSPREWRIKNKMNEDKYMFSKGDRALGELEDNYYKIGDELQDIITNINHVASSPGGRDWEADNLGKGELNKEIKLFKQIIKLYDRSKLGKVL